MSEHAITVANAEYCQNAQGTPYSQAFGDVYHSAEGGAAQARHVFIGGNDLPGRWRCRDNFTIIETGFGLGLNFLETWRAYADDPQAAARLHFISTEKFPLSCDGLAKAHACWPEHAERSRELLATWPLPLAGFHRLHLARGRITLTLLLGDAMEMLQQLVARADAFYLDGFSPALNPQMWSAELFAQLARLAAPEATLATWSVSAMVKDGLKTTGFRLTKRAGYASKREMLTGKFSLTPCAAPADAMTHAWPTRRAIIIGAGLAGTACANRLAARGWAIDLIDRKPGPATEGSGNPFGLAAPVINFADSGNARLSRAAFLYALRHFASLMRSCEKPIYQTNGVLRLARHAREAQRLCARLGEAGFPAALACYADANETARRAGRPTRGPGVWFPSGTMVSPIALCNAHLQQYPDHIHTHFGIAATHLGVHGDNWQVLDASESLVAEAPVVIVAAAAGSSSFAQTAWLRLESMRGQVTLLAPDSQRRLDVPVTGDSHAFVLPDGRMLTGATFQADDFDIALRTADHAANIARIDSMLPGLCAGVNPEGLDGRASFRTVTPDRLPVFGPIECGAPGLYAATGLGARGLVWAPLGAELLASQICGDPWPLPRELAAAAAPARFRR